MQSHSVRIRGTCHHLMTCTLGIGNTNYSQLSLVGSPYCYVHVLILWLRLRVPRCELVTWLRRTQQCTVTPNVVLHYFERREIKKRKRENRYVKQFPAWFYIYTPYRTYATRITRHMDANRKSVYKNSIEFLITLSIPLSYTWILYLIPI